MTISPSSTQPAGSRREQRVVQLGKIAIERPQVAALDEDVGRAAKDDRAKAVPLRLVQERWPRRQLVGQLREHRLDRRRDRKHRWMLSLLQHSASPGCRSLDHDLAPAEEVGVDRVGARTQQSDRDRGQDDEQHRQAIVQNIESVRGDPAEADRDSTKGDSERRQRREKSARNSETTGDEERAGGDAGNSGGSACLKHRDCLCDGRESDRDTKQQQADARPARGKR